MEFTLAAYVEANEGRRKLVYDDATGLTVLVGELWTGTLTIGIGHTGKDVVAGLEWDDPMIDAHFARDLAIAAAAAAMDIGVAAWPRLDPVRKVALIDMAFELGQTRLMGFEKMIAAVRAFQWTRAAAECRASRYDRQEHGRAERNAAMLESGVACSFPLQAVV